MYIQFSMRRQVKFAYQLVFIIFLFFVCILGWNFHDMPRLNVFVIHWFESGLFWWGVAFVDLYIYMYVRINFFFFNLLRTFCPHLSSFFVLFILHYVSAKFHLWPSSGDLTATSDRNAESCKLKKAKGEIWPKRREEETTQKNYQDDKKSAINK